MLNFENTTLVIQGNIVKETYQFYSEHRKKFSNIILSTWEGSDVSQFDCPIILNKMPEKVGGGNLNLQATSSINGISSCKTDFVFKCRTDIRIDNPEGWLNFCSEQYRKNLLFVLGLSHSHPYSPRDQIFISERDVLLNMFSVPLLNEEHRNPTVNDNMWPELYLGLNHCRVYDAVAEQCWNNPSLVKTNSVLEHWKHVKTNYMLPVPTYLKYFWPKHYPSGYPYTKTDFGEFWFDTM